MIILICVLSLLVLIGSLVIFNLLKKVEKYEEDVIIKNEFFDKLKEMSDHGYNKIVDLDINKAFESDDEVGFFFKNLKNIVMTIDAYLKNYSK